MRQPDLALLATIPAWPQWHVNSPAVATLVLFGLVDCVELRLDGGYFRLTTAGAQRLGVKELEPSPQLRTLRDAARASDESESQAAAYKALLADWDSAIRDDIEREVRLDEERNWRNGEESDGQRDGNRMEEES